MVCLNCQYQNCALHNKKQEKPSSEKPLSAEKPSTEKPLAEKPQASAVQQHQQGHMTDPDNSSTAASAATNNGTNNINSSTAAHINNVAKFTAIMNNINNANAEAAGKDQYQPFARSTPSRKSSISLSSFRKSSHSVSFSDDAVLGPPNTSPTHRRSVPPNFNGATSSSFRVKKTSRVSFSDSGGGKTSSGSSSIHFPRVITGSTSFSPSRRKSTNSVSISDSSESCNTNNVTLRRFSCVSPGSPDLHKEYQPNGTSGNDSSYSKKYAGRMSLDETSSSNGSAHSTSSMTSSVNLQLVVPNRAFNRSLSSPCSSSPTSSPGRGSPLFSNDPEGSHHHHHHRVKKKSKWKRLLKGKKDKKVSPEAISRWKSADNIYMSSGGSPRGSDNEGKDMGSSGGVLLSGGVGGTTNHRLVSSMSAYPLTNIEQHQQQEHASPSFTGTGQHYTSSTPPTHPSPHTAACTDSITSSTSSSSSSISNISQPLGPPLPNTKSTSTPLTAADLHGKEMSSIGESTGNTPTPLDLSNIPPETHVTMPTPTETTGENKFSGSPAGSPQNSPRVPRRSVSHETSDTDATQQQYSSHHISRATDSQGNESGNLSRDGSMERSYTDQSGYMASMEFQTSDKMGKGDKKNKKAWYNFSATYKSRSVDLKRLFKNLPGDERLIVDYSCALQKDILVHGRLYVTPNYFCFYSKIFGWETFMSIRCKDIVSMTKEKTALVIPNAIQINSDSEKNFFTSFASRDKTYLMLFRIWQNALMDQQMSSTELWQWVHSSYGNELGLTSDDDDYVAPSTEDDMAHGSKHSSSLSHMISASHLSTVSHSEPPPRLPDNSLEDASQAEVSIDESPSGPQKTTTEQLQETHEQVSFKSSKDSPSKNEHKKRHHSGVSDGLQTAEALPTDMSDSTESDKENKAHGSGSETVICPVIGSHHIGKEVINAVYNLPVDAVFTLLFTNSTFMLDLYASRKTFDVVASPWQSNNETNQKLRQVTYTLTLPPNSFGPKVSHVTETQVLSSFSKPGEMYTVDAEACNAGIPYADSFFVGNHWCLTRESNNETRITVWTQVKYKKSVWGFMKGVIDKNSYAGVESMLVDINDSLVTEADRTNQKKTRRRRRVRGGSKVDTVEIIPPIKETLHHKDHHTKIPQAPPRKMTLPNIHVDTSGSSEGPVRMVVATLVVLLTLNALLYYKLWDLEDKLHLNPRGNSNPYTTLDPNMLRSSSGQLGPVEEWVRVLQQQEALHAAEVDRWRRSIEDAAGFLRKAEEALRGLHSSIPENQASKAQILLMQLRKIQELEKSDRQATTTNSQGASDALNCPSDPNKPPDDSSPSKGKKIEDGDGQEL